MYKQQPASRWRMKYSLPDDYKVDGFLCYGSWDSERIKQLFIAICSSLYAGGFKIEEPLHGFMLPILSVLINGKRIWFVVEYGGVKLCEYLHRACMFGSQGNILVGSCGGLNNELHTNDIIIPSFSFGDESSTRMYERTGNHKHFSSPILNEKLKAGVEKRGISYFEKPTVTCGAMLAETWEDVVNRSDEGYYGVEMEASTIFAVSQHFQVMASAILYVSDNLIKEQIVGDESYNALKEAREELQHQCISLSIETLTGISKEL